MATQHFIRHNDYADTLKIGHLLLHDKEDLIRKIRSYTLAEYRKLGGRS